MVYNSVGTPYRKKFNAGNHILWFAAIMTGVSVFLPYISENMLGDIESINLIGTVDEPRDGIFFLAFAILILIFNACKLNTGNVIVSILSAILLIVEIQDIQTNKDSIPSRAIIEYEAGYYLLIVGCVLMFFASFLGLALHISAKNKVYNY